MIYRRTRPADRIQIKELCEKHNLEYDGREPYFGFIAADEKTDAVEGFSYTHITTVIDPFICPNPLAAIKLFCYTQGAISLLSNQIPISSVVVQVSKENKKLIDEINRLGYEKIESKYSLFKKVT